MLQKRSLGFILIIIFIGALIGTALGEILGLLLPQGVVREFFLRSANPIFGPATLNLGLFTITFGFSFKFNIIGIIGVIVAAYILRWFR